jgi:hypothetical protein
MRALLFAFLGRVFFFGVLGAFILLVLAWFTLWIVPIGFAAYLVIISLVLLFLPMQPASDLVFYTRRKRWGFIVALVIYGLNVLLVATAGVVLWQLYAPTIVIPELVTQLRTMLLLGFVVYGLIGLGLTIAGACIGVVRGQQRRIDIDFEREFSV